MILGTIEGKSTTTQFAFHAKEEPKNMDYVQVYHKAYEYVLCQIMEVTKLKDRTEATCQVIGYKDNGRVKRPRIPFDPGTEVLTAEDEFIADIISLQTTGEDDKPHAYLGKLDGRDIPVHVDLNTVLTKHVAVLAKSGAGKSYTVGVLLEEIAERGVPLVIIDPHGEYEGLAKANEDEEEKELLAQHGLEPKAYNVAEYGDNDLLPNVKPFRLPTHLTAQELTHLLPGKLSANQQAILYSALKNLKDVTFDNLLYELEAEESPAKYNIISTIDYLRGLPFFSAAPTPYNELVKPGQATIINLKGIPTDIQEIITYKLSKDLFHLRKQNKISPFFLVIEEAHNYCPERSFGETKASKTLRDIASEGRKFGLGLCVISQRPARVDKSVISQCSTQVILKVTNPNDLKALATSVEGLTAEAEKEIKNLPIGTALVTGITDVPLFVNVRPRVTTHGGDAVDILGAGETAGQQEASLLDQAQEFGNKELLPLIKPSITPKDIELMSEEPLSGVRTTLLPAYQLVCREGEQRYKLLVEREQGRIITDKDEPTLKKLPRLDQLSPTSLRILQTAFTKGPLTKEELAAATKAMGVDQDVEELTRQGYLEEHDGAYDASDDYLFTKLSKAATYDNIAYEEAQYDEKREPAMTIDDLKEQYGKFTTIEDHHECWLVNHQPIRATKEDQPW